MAIGPLPSTRHTAYAIPRRASPLVANVVQRHGVLKCEGDPALPTLLMTPEPFLIRVGPSGYGIS